MIEVVAAGDATSGIGSGRMISIPFLPDKTDSAVVIALAAVTGSVAILSAAVAVVVVPAVLADQVVQAASAAVDVVPAVAVAACLPRLSARAKAS